MKEIINENTIDKVLDASKIRFGYLCENGQAKPKFLLKSDENKAKEVMEDKEYFITDSKEEGKANILFGLNTFLYLMNLGELYKDFYSFDEWEQLLEKINISRSSSQEEKKQIDEVVDIVCNWWANAIKTNDLLQVLNKNILTDEDLERFKIALSNLIKTELSSNKSLILTIDKYLTKAAYDAKIDISFLWETYMIISLNEVSVSGGYDSSFEVIFERKKENKDETRTLSLVNSDEKKMD